MCLERERDDEATRGSVLGCADRHVWRYVCLAGVVSFLPPRSESGVRRAG